MKEHGLLQMKSHAMTKKALVMITNKLKAKAKWELTEEQAAEIEEWVKSELADGGTITKEEAHDALSAFADAHGFTISDDEWAMLEEAFDHVDTNDDGAIDLGELEAAIKKHGPPKKAKIQLKLKNKMKNKLKEWPELTEEQWQEIEDWVKSELAEGGTITKDEAAEALQSFADAHGFEITDEMWEEAEDAFDYVDANGDGAIDWPELEAVLEEHEPKKGKGKKGH